MRLSKGRYDAFHSRVSSLRARKMGSLKNCKVKHPTLKDILGNEKMIVPLANYIQATHRFEEGREE